jgi:hypothetical protein
MSEQQTAARQQKPSPAYRDILCGPQLLTVEASDANLLQKENKQNRENCDKYNHRLCEYSGVSRSIAECTKKYVYVCMR